MPEYSDPDNPFTFGDGNGDVPNSPNDIAWTCYGTCGNVDSSDGPIHGRWHEPARHHALPEMTTSGSTTGRRTTATTPRCSATSTSSWAGTEVAVPIVDDNGMFQGWAMFHVVSANQGAKTLTGYFVSGFNGPSMGSESLHVTGCTGDCPKPRYFGVYVLRLEN